MKPRVFTMDVRADTAIEPLIISSSEQAKSLMLTNDNLVAAITTETTNRNILRKNTLNFCASREFSFFTAVTSSIVAIVTSAVFLAKARNADYQKEGDAAKAKAKEDFIRAENIEYNDPNVSAKRKEEIATHYIKNTNNNGDSYPDFNTTSLLSAGRAAAKE